MLVGECLQHCYGLTHLCIQHNEGLFYQLLLELHSQGVEIRCMHHSATVQTVYEG